MPQTKALQLLLDAYRDEIAWLTQKAAQYEAEHDREVARDHLHRANNLQAILDGYERLAAKEDKAGP